MRRLLVGLSVFLLGTSSSWAAGYQGEDIDGQTCDCTDFSASTGKAYGLSCEFDGDEVLVFFPNGGHVILSLDDEDISSIDATDSVKGTSWKLDVEL